MKLQTNPGGLGSESLATSLGGELERLRFVIQRMLGTGTTYWYQAPNSSINDLYTALPSIAQTRIISGVKSANSSQLIALVPTGTTAASVVLSAATTPFVYGISGTNYTISTNVTVSGLSLAAAVGAATNCTASVLYNATPAMWTKGVGGLGTKISVTGMGTTFAAQVGSFVTVQNGTEYFLAYVESTSALTCAWRGSFFGTAATGLVANTIPATATLTLMRTGWLFAQASNQTSLAVTYNVPTIAGVQPSSPSTGDYWYNIGSTTWMTYNSVTWVTAASTLVGMCVQNTSACVAARTFDPFIAASALNTMTLDINNTASVIDRGPYSSVNVFGTKLSFGPTKTIWSMNANLDSNVTVGINQPYYFYLTESGVQKVSDVPPIQRRDLLGLYHPRETWRCLGDCWTDVNTAFVVPVRTFGDDMSQLPMLMDPNSNVTGSAAPILQFAAQTAFPTRFIHQDSGGAFIGFTTANTYMNVTTMALTPGYWALSATGNAQVISGTQAATQWLIGISTVATANSFTDSLVGFNMMIGAIVGLQGVNETIPLTGQSSGLTLPDCWVQVTATQNYYLKTRIVNYAASSAAMAWGFNARRIDDLNGGPA